VRIIAAPARVAPTTAARGPPQPIALTSALTVGALAPAESLFDLAAWRCR